METQTKFRNPFAGKSLVKGLLNRSFFANGYSS